MQTVRRAVGPLRVLLAVVVSALVAAQLWAVPGMVPDLTDPSLEQSVVRWTMLAVSALALLCVQVVVVCTWQLPTLVTRDRIFTAGALPWVDAIVAAMAAGWVMLLGAAVCAYYVVVDEVSDGAALPVLLLVLLLVGAVVALLMVVMRALLRQATGLRTDLEAVI